MSVRVAIASFAFLLLVAAPTAAVAAPQKAAEKQDTVEKQAPAAKSSTVARDQAREKALRDGWPDTPAGMVGSGWVEAFSTGEAAMRAFLAANVAEADLAKRPIEDRIANYRKLRERFGALTLAAVEQSAPTELTVALLADDATTHRFVFKVGSKAPHPLVSVSFYDRVPGHGGHGFHR